MATYSHEGTGALKLNICFGRKNKVINIYMIKTLKITLLATAAMAIVSTMAQAEELADFKAMFERMNRLNASSQAALQVPDGYVIYATADTAPVDGEVVDEPYVEVKVSGYVKGGYIYSQVKDTPPAGSKAPKDASSDFDAEAGVTVKGSVQSTLGEVGGSASLKWEIAESLDNTTSLKEDGWSGFWQFAPTMKLDIGRGNGGSLDNGIEKNTRRIWTQAHKRVRAEKAGIGFFDSKVDNAFLGLTYADGPITLNVKAHDATRGVVDKLKFAGYDDDAWGVSSKALLTTDLVNFELSGGYWGQDDADLVPLANQTGVKWLAGAGTEINAIEGLSISLAAQTGRLHNDAETLNFSGSLGFALTEDITVGLGAGWKKISNSPTAADNITQKVVNGGIYYVPLSQMIIGLEGDWLEDGKPAATTNDGYTAAIVTRYSF
jgi:hypothetical protein